MSFSVAYPSARSASVPEHFPDLTACSGSPSRAIPRTEAGADASLVAVCGIQAAFATVEPARCACNQPAAEA